MLDRIARGDQRALADAIIRFGPQVKGTARRVLIDDHHAEEVAQDTFLALWERHSQIDLARGSVARWLATVARNKAIDRVRREERASRNAQLLDDPGPTGTTDLDERRSVLDALGQLTPLQREALFLAYFGGFTYREVARRLEVPEGTAKTRMRDGLARLRTVMEGTEAA